MKTSTQSVSQDSYNWFGVQTNTVSTRLAQLKHNRIKKPRPKQSVETILNLISLLKVNQLNEFDML